MSNEDIESFEEYISSSIDERWITNFREMFSRHGIESILEKTYVSYVTIPLDMKDQYDNTLHVFKHAYAAAKLTVCNSDELKQLDILVHGFYELDNLCGVDTDKPLHKLNQKDQLDELMKLDKDFIKFKDYYIKTKTQLSKDIFVKWFRVFAKMIFTFNGYQAPPRIDPKQALMDAMGVTDLFEELLGSY